MDLKFAANLQGKRANFKNVARLKIKEITFNLDILFITKCTYSLRDCKTSPPDLRLKRRECFILLAIVKCTHVYTFLWLERHPLTT